jgi:ribosomal protein S18 acetylase RimI-like enzyme
MFGVDEAMRGRGIGGALMRGCIERARAGGGARLWLHTEPGMESAGRLYVRNGFVAAPEHDLHFVHEGSPMVLYAYVLELQAT